MNNESIDIDPSTLRVIQTARGIDNINDAVEQGCTPLIKEVVPSEKIYVIDTLIRDKKTGKYQTVKYSSYATSLGFEGDNEIVISTAKYYPYQFPFHFAAYLIPEDLVEGERVILEDLIEDIVASRSAGARYRLDSVQAIWNGTDFVVDRNSYRMRVTLG